MHRGAERVFRARSEKEHRERRVAHRIAMRTARDRLFFLLSGVVGARNLTMECRKGRRKGAPILGGLLLAWLLTNGCAVVARNMGECEKVFTIPDRGSLPRVNLPSPRERPPYFCPPHLAPIKGPATTRARIFTRDPALSLTRGGATRRRRKPVLHPGAFRVLSLTQRCGGERARFKFSRRDRARATVATGEIVPAGFVSGN